MKCPDCHADLIEGRTCQDDFHQMLYWENEYPDFGSVHHLMVLCYYLQHPGLYSPDGLTEARRLLIEFVENGASPARVRVQNRERVNSRNRTWKIKATPDSRGTYANSIRWTMTAADVVTGGHEHYIDNVGSWAKSILEALRSSGNL